jgi:exodeoxyribonuclease VII small subunit
MLYSGQRRGAAVSKTDAKKTEPTFEEAMTRLEEIVSRLEAGDDSLEESIALFEEGTVLARLCQERLDSAQGKIEKLVEKANGQIVTEPMDLKE